MRIRETRETQKENSFIDVLICKIALILLGGLLVFGLNGAIAKAETPAGTYFTYQGRLEVMGEPANGVFDLRFNLYGDDCSTFLDSLILIDVPVTDGLFSVKLDFVSSVYSGQKLWLKIEVRPAGTGAFTLLSPCQELTTAPYSAFALNANLLDGFDSTGFAPATHVVDSGNPHSVTIGQVTDVLPDAKNRGSLLVGNGSAVVTLLLPVASDGQVLTVDFSQPTGLKWTRASNMAGAGMDMLNSWFVAQGLFTPHTNDCDGSESFVEIVSGTGLGFCIEKSQRGPQPWDLAKKACADAGKRLPEVFEWKYACRLAVPLGLEALVDDWEWASNFPESGLNETSSQGIWVPVLGGRGDCSSAFIGGLDPVDPLPGPDLQFRCVS